MYTRKRKVIIADPELYASWLKAVEDLARDEWQQALEERLAKVRNKIREARMKLTQVNKKIAGLACAPKS